MSTATAENRLACALDAAARGLRVLPLEVKRPLTTHGLKDASKDPATLKAWWAKWPDANIGIATGPGSGLFAVDVDSLHGGDVSFDDLEAKHGKLPDTVVVLTGNGRHYYLKYPADGRTIRNSAGKLGAGLDIRGDGGYVVGAGSIHISGRLYQYEASSDIGEVEIAAAPEWLLALLCNGTGKPAAPVGDRIAEGARNDTLASLAGTMRRRGMAEGAILAALQAENRTRCTPPLPDSELANIARSIGCYAPATALVDAPTTDLGNAQRLAYRAAGKALYCGQRAKFLIWKHDRWAFDEALDILTLAKKTALRIFDEAKAAADPDRQNALAKWAVKSQSRYALASMVDLARPDLAVNVEDLDADPFAFNVLNGTIDLKRTGELRPHSPDDLLTKLAPVHYDAAATCPLFDTFLHRIMAGNAALIGYLQRRAGMCLTADISEQSLWVDHGVGANGKNTLLDTLTGLMGDYACEAPPDLLLMRNSPEHPTETADLCGRRLVVCSETDEGRRLRVQLVKRLTGNARLKARFMRGDYFEFPRTHKMILVTNNRPVIKETTLAIWRRIKLVPFSVVIPMVEWDRHLTEKLVAERPGILNWAIKGCLDWQRDGMNEPAEVLTATAAYQAEQDPLAEFFDSCCIFAPHVEAPRADLFNGYAAWAERAKDHRPLDRTTFFERVRNRTGVDESQRRVDGKMTRLFTGIGLANVELFQP
ncbi:MAG: phage/plasmid primase, P4 family [Planctomycetota bacterium]|nr:phage/plasmid primase, P4 family [Planctomycetota bacterium]